MPWPSTVATASSLLDQVTVPVAPSGEKVGTKVMVVPASARSRVSRSRVRPSAACWLLKMPVWKAGTTVRTTMNTAATTMIRDTMSRTGFIPCFFFFFRAARRAAAFSSAEGALAWGGSTASSRSSWAGWGSAASSSWALAACWAWISLEISWVGMTWVGWSSMTSA